MCVCSCSFDAIRAGLHVRDEGRKRLYEFHFRVSEIRQPAAEYQLVTTIAVRHYQYTGKQELAAGGPPEADSKSKGSKGRESI